MTRDESHNLEETRVRAALQRIHDSDADVPGPRIQGVHEADLSEGTIFMLEIIEEVIQQMLDKGCGEGSALDGAAIFAFRLGASYREAQDKELCRKSD